MDNFIHWLIFTLLIKAVALPSSIMCPYLPLWEARSKMFCKGNPTLYHCLTDQAGNLREACLKPVFINKGHYPVLSLDLDFIKPIKCPPTHYQPGGQMSNNYKSITCMYSKSQCDDDGEEKCDEGSDVTDRLCRCDHTRGYRSLEYLFENPRNQSCYHPKAEEKGCAMYVCPHGEELNPAYFCVKNCPKGFRRQKYEFGCVKINPLPSPSPTVQSPSTTKPHTTSVIPVTKIHKGMDSMLKTKDDDRSAYIGAVVGSSVVAAVLLFGLIVFVVVYFHRKESHKPNHSTLSPNLLPDTELPTSSRSGNPSASRSNIQAETVIQNLHIHYAENLAIGSNNTVTSIAAADLSE